MAQPGIGCVQVLGSRQVQGKLFVGFHQTGLPRLECPDWVTQTGSPRLWYPDCGTQTGVPRPGYSCQGTQIGGTKTRGMHTGIMQTGVPSHRFILKLLNFLLQLHFKHHFTYWLGHLQWPKLVLGLVLLDILWLNAFKGKIMALYLEITGVYLHFWKRFV